MTFSGCGAFMHPSIEQTAEISHLPGHRGLEPEKGRAAAKQQKCFSFFSSPHACLHTTKALHIFTKPTSALLFMPNSCHPRQWGFMGS